MGPYSLDFRRKVVQAYESWRGPQRQLARMFEFEFRAGAVAALSTRGVKENHHMIHADIGKMAKA